jgi:O-acetyl-ADP-ribose deacetylase (regulator of RNase III)
LAGCYRNSLALAAERGIKTVAFPAISTGAYGFPLERAARIAVREVRRYLEHNTTIGKVVFVCFGRAAYETYRTALKEADGMVHS